MTDPWEHSAESALRFAFGMLARELAVQSVFSNLLARSPLSPRELSKLELRAQAALLRAQAASLADPVAKCWIVAYYLPKPVEEAQPGGRFERVDHWADDRRTAVQGVAYWLMGQAGTGAHRYRGYIEIVSQYTLGRPSSRRLREMFKMDANRVREKRDDCRVKLEELHKRSVFLYDARLVELGVLRERSESC